MKAIRNQVLMLIAVLVLFCFMDKSGLEKYIICAFFSVLFLILGRKNQWNAEALLIMLIPLSIYIFIGSSSGIFHGTFQMSGVKNLLYIMLPILFSFSGYVFLGAGSERIVDWQMLACFVTYILPNAWIMLLGYTWESTYAFAFGIFAIYYAYKKRWILFTLALCFLYVADKRIAVVGVVLALLIMGVVWFFKNSRKLVFTIWTLTIAAIYLYLYLIYSGKLEAICWGLNINTNGRTKMYTRMATQYDFLQKFLGNGIGVMENLLKYLQIDSYAYLHNDLLKFYIELGFFGLLLYLVSYYFVFYLAEKYFGNKEIRFLIGAFTYLALLFATDNVSVYLMFLIPFYSTIFAVLSSAEKTACDKRWRSTNDKDAH